MKKYWWFVVGVLVANAAAWWLLCVAPDALFKTSTAQSGQSVAVVDAFTFTLQDEVRKKIGQPIEGYEPQMFLDVFPGLVETDFDGVEASIGRYTIVNGRLEHQVGEAKLIHSAATAVTKEGMNTLLKNVSRRTGIDLASDGTLTDIMSALTAQ